MVLNEKNVKRLLLYFFYDKDGIVDDYVLFFLSSISDFCSDIVFISNGKLEKNSYGKLGKLDNLSILERENKGFDVWAYKEGLEFVGFDKLDKYDEIIAANFTIMGPVYPFSEMFDSMNERDLDFWGITKHYPIPFDIFEGRTPNGIEEHIQSHFMVFRKSLFLTEEFKDYWTNIPKIEHYYDSVCLHEAIFTKKFERLGFKWDVYVYTDDLKEVALYPLQMIPKELLENRKCPVFKRRNFFHDYQAFINHTAGEPTFELLEFIKNSTNYNTNLIYENIIRTVNQADFKAAMQHNYILPTDTCKNKEFKNIKVALCMHLYYIDLLDELLFYAKSIPSFFDVYITTNSNENKTLIEEKFSDLKCNKLTVDVIENRGRTISALYVAKKDYLLDYDYVCTVHDKKVKQLSPLSIGKSFSYHCFENVLKNENFVLNVIDTFEKNEHLGLLIPPTPFHADYFPTLGKEWRGSFKCGYEFLKSHGFSAPINENKEPIAPLGDIFWFRVKALKPIFDLNLKYEDFPKEPIGIDDTILHAIERVQSFVAQSNRFYTGWLLSDTFSKIYITNLTFTIREFNKILFKHGIESTQYNMCGELDRRLFEYSNLKLENENLKNIINSGNVSLKVVLKRFIKSLFNRRKK